jgi:hypothetical protein
MSFTILYTVAGWSAALRLAWKVDAKLVHQTMLSGYVRDQAALHGMLNKIRDLNLVLVAVECLSFHQNHNGES